MSFTLPTFNLKANIMTGSAIGPVRLTADCNLAYGRRVNTMSTGGTTLAGVPLLCMTLLLPIGTDIRGPLSATGNDYVEVPRGSGRIYRVFFVDDAGKGFSNEHRVAGLEQAIQPTPLP